ncbi:hypothetical protein EON67_03125 [archaeon]|nr:MAG: hypothetical protein EON67_03125 [archaeon]
MEPRLICTGRFEDGVSGRLLGAAKLLRLNADSSRLAILSNLPAANFGTPDTHVHVFEVSNDRLTKYAPNPKHVPVYLAWDAADARLLCVQSQRVHTAPLVNRIAGAAIVARAVGGADERGAWCMLFFRPAI